MMSNTKRKRSGYLSMVHFDFRVESRVGYTTQPKTTKARTATKLAGLGIFV